MTDYFLKADSLNQFYGQSHPKVSAKFLLDGSSLTAEVLMSLAAYKGCLICILFCLLVASSHNHVTNAK